MIEICKWDLKFESDGYNIYETTCKKQAGLPQEDGYEREFIFCPYCGKTVKFGKRKVK